MLGTFTFDLVVEVPGLEVTALPLLSVTTEDPSPGCSFDVSVSIVSGISEKPFSSFSDDTDNEPWVSETVGKSLLALPQAVNDTATIRAAKQSDRGFLSMKYPPLNDCCKALVDALVSRPPLQSVWRAIGGQSTRQQDVREMCV